MELIKKVLPNRRVSTILESIHVNMALLITEISLRRLILSSKKLDIREKDGKSLQHQSHNYRED